MHHDDHHVEYDIDEADDNQEESQHVAHFGAYIAAKEQQCDAEDVDCHFVDHVLIVDDRVNPLVLLKCINEHDQALD